MADNEGIWSPFPTQPPARSPKLRIYESLFLFNQGVDHLVALLHDMQKLPFAEKEELRSAVVEIEEVRCDMNADFTEQLADSERFDEGQFWKQRRAFEKTWRDPKGFDDAPYWPAQICWTYKEVWTQPVGQWVWLMQDVSVPAIVRGVADPGVHTPIEFREQKTGQKVLVTPPARDGAFETTIPQGRYDVTQGPVHTAITVLPGESYRIDLRPDHAFNFSVTYQQTAKNEVTIRVSSQGVGHHSFAILTENLALTESSKQEIDLGAAGNHEIIWHARITLPGTPWVAVIVPDGALNERRELTGAVSAQK